MSTSIADTSFIIDWVRYSKRNLIFQIFKLVWIPETVLAEIKSEHAISWVAQNLASDKMAIFPEIPEIRNEALKIIETSRTYPIKSLDYPEAFCLAVGKNRNITVLSENGGAYIAQFTFMKEVKVWRAFELLLELYKRKLIEKKDFNIYQRETLHRFPKKDIERLKNGEI